ncbi:MAG: hypothetical protein U5S82_14385 [Gammaproteobacteria bacterium]|nr:hypothetical protein [Gammaproteobacteria bacterium]
MARRMLLLLLAAAWSVPAAAHLLNVFAWTEGDTIHGYAYFAGGGRAAGARIAVRGPDDTILATLEPDAAGEFNYVTESRVPHRIVADTGDGHRATWTVSAAELGAAADTTAQSTTAPAPATDPGAPPAGDPLAALVERAVARQVGPLRAELQAHARRARLGDVVGGIGFIFGIAGVVLWWRSRRRGP